MSPSEKKYTEEDLKQAVTNHDLMTKMETIEKDIGVVCKTVTYNSKAIQFLKYAVLVIAIIVLGANWPVVLKLLV